MTAPILIVKLGATAVPEYGDFDRLIAAGAGLADDAVLVVDPVAGEALPDPRTVAGVIVTGSSAMVTSRLPWSERTAAWVPTVVDAGVPFFGICYGHQLLAHALGGEVAPNPRGREIGTVEVRLCDVASADPLFDDLPPVLAVHATHVESVVRLPDGARLLAANTADPHHAFAVGARAWGVQFHPEFDAAVMRGYLTARAEVLRDEGLDAEALVRDVTDTPHATALLRRFTALARSGH